MLRRALLFLGVAVWQVAWPSECAMRPSPIDVKRIARHAAVQSHVVDANRLSLTALLRNGRALKLVHSGCDLAGAQATLWLENGCPFSETKAWLEEASALAHIAFVPSIANDIVTSLRQGNFVHNATETRVVISASRNSFMSYSVVISGAEHGVLLSVAYELA